MSEHLANLFNAQDNVRLWRNAVESAQANLEVAKVKANCNLLLSQHDPVNKMNIDREKLKMIFSFLWHGQLDRLQRDFESFLVDNAKKEAKL